MTKNSLWLALIAVALAAAGCSEFRALGEGKPKAAAAAVSAQYCTSNSDDCSIAIVVDTSQVPCRIRPFPDVTVVSQAHDVHIVWTLDAPDDYKLDYLRFKDEQAKYREQFASRITIPSRDQFYDKKLSARQAEAKDRNTKDGSWYYEVKVGNGRDSCKLDPPMVNG